MKTPELTARQRILNAACAVFAEHPYEEATTRLICLHANVQHSNLYYYFKSKKELYRAVFRTVYDIENAMTYSSLLRKEPHLFMTPEGKAEVVERIVWDYFRRHVHISGWKQKFITGAIRGASPFMQLIDEELTVETEELKQLFHFLRPDGTVTEATYWAFFLDSQGLYYFMTPESNQRCLQKKKNSDIVIHQIARIMVFLAGLPDLPKRSR